MKQIILHGVLGEKFGERFEFYINTAAEAVRAIGCQVEGFNAFLLASEQQGIKYAVYNDKNNIGEDELTAITSAETIHIIPKIIGSGGRGGGILKFIGGAALVGFGLATGGAGFGLAAQTMIMGGGASLMVGGLTQMLIPPIDTGDPNPDGNRPNFGFGGAVTTVAQGGAVPVLLGEREVGGFVASTAIYTENEQ